ncbi:MAG: creatininase family protein [Candidatus Altiarchaeota archaeon]|nr:creatininase family protein [Candidatus Altiarchaeota archaeon]
MSYNLADKTWCELKEETGKVIIPVGSIEQHGPHLPLSTDSLLVERISEKVAELTDSILIPTVCFGISEEHMDFKGSLTLTPDSFKGMVLDICTSLKRHGFKKQHIINYHGSNKKHLIELLPEIRGRGIEVFLHRVLGRIGVFDHAGEVETSLMLYLYPERVRVNEIKGFKYKIPEREGWRTIDYSSSGVIGDAVNASADKGEQYFRKLVDEIVEEVENGG